VLSSETSAGEQMHRRWSTTNPAKTPSVYQFLGNASTCPRPVPRSAGADWWTPSSIASGVMPVQVNSQALPTCVRHRYRSAGKPQRRALHAENRAGFGRRPEPCAGRLRTDTTVQISSSRNCQEHFRLWAGQAVTPGYGPSTPGCSWEDGEIKWRPTEIATGKRFDLCALIPPWQERAYAGVR